MKREKDKQINKNSGAKQVLTTSIHQLRFIIHQFNSIHSIHHLKPIHFRKKK